MKLDPIQQMQYDAILARAIGAAIGLMLLAVGVGYALFVYG